MEVGDNNNKPTCSRERVKYEKLDALVYAFTVFTIVKVKIISEK